MKELCELREKGIKWEDLLQNLSELEQAVKIEDQNKIREIFLNTVDGYNPESEIFDSMHRQYKKMAKESGSNK